MEIIIQENKQYGLVVSSRIIAEQLKKRHSDVLESLEKILTDGDFRSLIIPSEYKDKKGELRKEYLLTKDGFTLYMFNIRGYNDFKIAYIKKFNEMEQKLSSNNFNIDFKNLNVEKALVYVKGILNQAKANLLMQKVQIEEKIKELDKTGLTDKMECYITQNGEIEIIQDL